MTARLPFEWVGGDPALDFNNTVSWNSEGLREERLRIFRDLVEWSEEAGLTKHGRALRERAARHAASAARALARAKRLRATLHTILTALAVGRAPAREELEAFNAALRGTLARAQLVGRRKRLTWSFADAADVEAPLDRLLWSAAQLLGRGWSEPLRRCANPDCGWVFLDQSRKRNRRWCDMQVCGSRAKARRYYARRKAGRLPV